MNQSHSAEDQQSHELVLVSKDEWDAIRADISTLIECHRAIRELAPYVFSPEEITDQQRIEAAMFLQHFFRTYGSEDG
jgi:hypothetical protein